MTLDQCRSDLNAIRRCQGTYQPMILVECDGVRHRGRLVRSDSDPQQPHDPRSPFGTLTLASPGLLSDRETILQIASIRDGGLHDLQGCEALVETARSA